MKTALGIATGGLLGAGLFNSPPKPKPPPLMPDPNDPLAQLAQRQKMAKTDANKMGRASTILSPSGDYSSTGF